MFSYRLSPAVAAFSLLSALFHALVASPWGFGPYQRELAAQRNRFRWVEYSLSATLMVLLIAVSLNNCAGSLRFASSISLSSSESAAARATGAR